MNEENDYFYDSSSEEFISDSEEDSEYEYYHDPYHFVCYYDDSRQYVINCIHKRGMVLHYLLKRQIEQYRLQE